MYYIEVVMYGGKIFKYIAGKERDAKFIKTLLNFYNNYSGAVKQINIINLYEKENNENDN